MTTMDSHYKFPASRLKTDQFFLHWLAQPENQELVWQLVEDCKAGRPLKGPTTTPTSSRATPRSPRLSSPPSTAFSPTPSSPSKAQLPASPQASPSAKVTPPVTTATTAELPDAVPEPGIPRFFHPKTAASSEQVAAFNVTVRAAFHQHGGAVTANQLHTVLPDICNCPGYLAFEVFRKAVAGPAQERVSGEQFVSWWRKEGLVGADPDTCVFQVLRQPGTEYLTQGDLTQFMQHVLQHHPGLEFLQETAEFQEHYAHTVVFRILYTLDRTEKGVLTLADVKRGSLAQAMMQLDREEDINKVLRFFSYEHFYVMYCKFWELDQDHDFMIDRDDLLRYGQHGLTYRIVDRIFQQAPRRFACQTPGKMGYEDFVYFILSEEDKTTDASLKYWHRCADLDDDGIVTTEDMRFFYEEQLHRMESASQAPVTFNDIMCQMQDMLSPSTPGHFSLRDLRKTRQLAGTLFNILFNISKFVAYETRDPFLIRQEKTDDPDATEWDRFARQEYIRLALEEETADDSQMDTDGVWEPQEAAALLDIGGGMQARDGMDSSHTSGGSSPLVTPSFLS